MKITKSKIKQLVHEEFKKLSESGLVGHAEPSLEELSAQMDQLLDQMDQARAEEDWRLLGKLLDQVQELSMQIADVEGLLPPDDY